jgi:hypothetical protein
MARRLRSGTSEVLAQNEISRLFLRIEVRHLPIIGSNSGGCLGKLGPPADGSGQKFPGLHLRVARGLCSECAIGT